MPARVSQLALGGSCLSRNDPLNPHTLLTFHLPSAYGHVVLTAVGSIFMIMWKGIQVFDK